MSNDLSRRKFLKFAAAMGASLGLPFSWTTQAEGTITFVKCEIDDDQLSGAMRLGKTKVANGQLIMEITMDEIEAWAAVILVDDRSREWRTDDGARTFRHGDLVFEWGMED